MFMRAGRAGWISRDPCHALDTDDPLMIAKCIAGDDRAWESIVQRYLGRILHLSYRFAGSREEAEDLTQDVFIRVYRNLSSYRMESGSLHTWIYAVARNLIIDHFRQNRRFQSSIGSTEMEALNLEEDRVLDPHQAVEQAEASQFVRNGLHNLSPNLRQAVQLRDIEGMAYQEIARHLCLSEGTVKSRVKRGRTQLARILQRRGVRRGDGVHPPIPLPGSLPASA